MDEFVEHSGLQLLRKQSSDKVPSISSLKKSMSDITTKVGRTKSISFTSLVKTQSCDKGSKETQSPILYTPETRARADTGNKRSFFSEEEHRLRNRASSPNSRRHVISLLDFTDNMGLMER